MTDGRLTPHPAFHQTRRLHGALAAACLAAAGCSGQGPQLSDNFEATLRISLAGTGTGRVTADAENYELSFGALDCGDGNTRCEATHDLDGTGATTVGFTAVPSAGSTFAGWSGSCTASPSDAKFATLELDEEATFVCTAVFNLSSPPPPPATCSAQFGETDWITPAWNIVVVSSDGASSQSISLANTGGNPSGPTFGGLENPQFRKMLHTMDLPAGTSGTSRITVAQFPQGGTYNPPSPIAKFVYREDQIIVSNPDALPVTWGMAVRQGGTVYLAPLGTFNTPTWQRQEADVTQATFTAPGPDLTQPFEVGFFRSTTTGANPAAGSSVEHGIDNWQIEVCK